MLYTVGQLPEPNTQLYQWTLTVQLNQWLPDYHFPVHITIHLQVYPGKPGTTSDAFSPAVGNNNIGAARGGGGLATCTVVGSRIVSIFRAPIWAMLWARYPAPCLASAALRAVQVHQWTTRPQPALSPDPDLAPEPDIPDWENTPNIFDSTSQLCCSEGAECGGSCGAGTCCGHLSNLKSASRISRAAN